MVDCRVRFRPAIAADVRTLTDQELPHRIKAITATLDGEVIGIGGLGYCPDGTVIAFAEIGEKLRQYPAAVHRAGKLGMALIRASGVALVVAEAQPGNPAAERWLRHFGFQSTEFAGRKAFVWRRSA